MGYMIEATVGQLGNPSNSAAGIIMIDTAAPITRIRASVAKRLKLEATSVSPIATWGGVHHSKFYVVALALTVLVSDAPAIIVMNLPVCDIPDNVGATNVLMKIGLDF